jgi:GMP synthase (glutamine-hydrolysing)
LAGLVVLGGPMNADQLDRYPFLAREREWIRHAMEVELPLLGLCLGSQIIARTLGAEVRPNSVKEIGWYDLELLPTAADDPLLGCCGIHERVFQWHGDTFDIPPDCIPLARSAACENQAFRHANSTYAFQFHLEVTGPIIETWLTEPGGCAEVAALDYIDAEEIRRLTPEYLPPMHVLARRVFTPFVEMCRDRAADG